MNLSGDDMKLFRRRAQIIFQDPFSSLNPRLSILDSVGEPLLVNNVARGRELEERVREVIVQVGLRVEHLRRFPHSFSGGQRQRIGIARALVVNPKIVVADEPVSALDVSIQAQILNLLVRLQEEFHLTYLFVSHDMSVVRYICDRIAVMYAGKLVEIGPKDDVLSEPRHPYTELLLAAVPRTARGSAVSGPSPPASRPTSPTCRRAASSATAASTPRTSAPSRSLACRRSMTTTSRVATSRTRFSSRAFARPPRAAPE